MESILDVVCEALDSLTNHSSQIGFLVKYIQLLCKDAFSLSLHTRIYSLYTWLTESERIRVVLLVCPPEPVRCSQSVERLREDANFCWTELLQNYNYLILSQVKRSNEDLAELTKVFGFVR